MTEDNLTARVENLERITAYLKERLFRAERRLLIAGTLLTHADEVPLHGFVATLKEASREFSSELRDLDDEENNCCPMLAGVDADDQGTR